MDDNADPRDDLDVDVTDDAGAERMLELLTDPQLDPEVRAEAAINLGPGLETCHNRESFGDSGVFFSQDVFEQIDETFRKLFEDDSAPDPIRRRVLEAGVRCPRPWHEEAIREAFDSDRPEWRQTALFGMGYVSGFDDDILEVLRDDTVSDDLLRVAARAAGKRALEDAEPIIRRLAVDGDADLGVRLPAIEALTRFDDEECERALERLSNHPNQHIARLAHWAAKQWQTLHGSTDEIGGPPGPDQLS